MTPQHEQTWVEYASFTSSKTTPARRLLYSNIVFNINHPASSVDFAILVLTNFLLLTLPTKIAVLSATSFVLNLCCMSLR